MEGTVKDALFCSAAVTSSIGLVSYMTSHAYDTSEKGELEINMNTKCTTNSPLDE